MTYDAEQDLIARADRTRLAEPRSNEQRLADSIEQLANALVGWRTTRIGNVTVTERAVQRFQPQACAKCQSRDATVVFHHTDPEHRRIGDPRLAEERLCGRNDLMQTASPHLHVYCQVCRFDWTEGIQAAP